MIHEEDQDYDQEDDGADDNEEEAIDAGYEVQVEQEEPDSNRHHDEEMDEDDEDQEIDEGQMLEMARHHQAQMAAHDEDMYGEEDEEEMIEIEESKLHALLLQHERIRNGEDPGEPILDEHGQVIQLTDEEYEAALATLNQQQHHYAM